MSDCAGIDLQNDGETASKQPFLPLTYRGKGDIEAQIDLDDVSQYNLPDC